MPWPSGFIPTEDQGMVYVNVTTPPGATVERTEDVLNQVQRIAEKLKPVESISTLAGYSLVNDAAGSSYGMGMINLKGWDEREQSVTDFITELEEKTRGISDADIQFLPPRRCRASATAAASNCGCWTSRAAAICKKRRPYRRLSWRRYASRRPSARPSRA